MDLRIQKTRAAIKSAFLELRRKKPIEKITVTELAKLAEINKATFYLHYSDIYSLADEMEDEVIDDILSEIQGLNKFFDDPRKYTAEMRRALLNNLSTLNSVFSGSRYSGFAEKIEAAAADYQELARLMEEKQQAEDTLAQMMEQWEALSCELEDAT